MAQHYLDPLQYLLCKDDTSPVKIDYVGLKQHPEAVGSFDRFTLTYDDGTEVILDGDVSLREEPLLRGSNGLCVYRKSNGSKTLRIKDANGLRFTQLSMKSVCCFAGFGSLASVSSTFSSGHQPLASLMRSVLPSGAFL